MNNPGHFTAQQAFKVLEAVGTPAILDVLRAKVKDNNPSVKQAAQAAIKAIEERDK